MDYLHRVLKNSYPDWMIKENEKKQAIPIIIPDTGLEVNKNVFITLPCFCGLSEEFRRTFLHTYVKAFSKEPTPLNLSFCTIKIKFLTTQAKHSLQMVLPRRKLQLFLHRRIQQMFGKESKRTQ